MSSKAPQFAALDEGAKSPGAASPAAAPQKAASHEEEGAHPAPAAAGAKHAPGPAGDGKSSIAGAVFNLANAVRATSARRGAWRAARARARLRLSHRAAAAAAAACPPAPSAPLFRRSSARASAACRTR